METKTLMEQLWKQVERSTTADEIMEDVEIVCRLRERQVLRGSGFKEEWLDQHYPLPVRTQRVLREEPVPGYGDAGALFRWNPEMDRFERSDGGGFSHLISPVLSPQLVKHLADLYDNPYREDCVPVDPDKPWP